uniref:Pseudouridine synthase RsuA/RluA-like domain-containing protein n=1 Tax=Schistocephalus solidus TaxID=70667 RepID=A0A0X3NRZ1_SCHSO
MINAYGGLPRQVCRELKSCLQVKVYPAVNRNTSKIVPELGLTSDLGALVTLSGQGNGEKPRAKSRKDLHLIAIQRQQQQQPVKYYSDNGFRKVVPYYYTFTAFCKRRWVGQKLYDVLASEFNFDSEEMIKHRMTHGQIKVNGSPVGLDYMLRDSDLVEHNVHRHELPVLDEEIKTVFEDDQLLVVNKPSSLPVHPCGQFHHNTLAKILYNERHISNLYVIHRLDRMTSGLILIGKTSESASKISSEISERNVSKYYVCEVEGKFKGPGQNASDPPTPVIVDQPLGRLNQKMGLNAVMPESEGGKPSKTSFIRIVWRKPKNAADPGSSIVLCRPHTGRTHQIRVHAQYLGFPLVDDPLYNSYDWGPTKGAFAKYVEPRSALIEALAASRSRSAYLQAAVLEEGPSDSETANNNGNTVSHTEDGAPPVKAARLDPVDAPGTTGVRYYPLDMANEEQRAILEAAYDRDCPDCNRRFADPQLRNLVLRLHAFRYSGSNWSFTAPLPAWATAIAREADELEGRDLSAVIEELLPLL